MLQLEKKIFACAMDFDGSNDFYIFRFEPKTRQWLQLYYRAAQEFTWARIFAGQTSIQRNPLRKVGVNTILIIAFNAGSPDNTYVSRDRGNTWAPLVVPHVFYCYEVVEDSTLWYAATTSKLYYSVNAGTTWVEYRTWNLLPILSPVYIFSWLGVARVGFLIVHEGGSVYKLRTAAGSSAVWDIIPTGLPGINECLRDGNRLIAFSSELCAISTDMGSTWSVPVALIPGKIMRTAAFSSDTRNHIILATNEFIMVSRDYGVTWVQSAATTGGENIHALVHDSEFQLFGINETNGIYYKMRSYGDNIDSYQFNDDVNIKARSMISIDAMPKESGTSTITKEITSFTTVSTEATLTSKLQS